ncbi:MAG: alcohol dehydrogenase catalytic domain-containing protein [Actinomycetota bacterium]
MKTLTTIGQEDLRLIEVEDLVPGPGHVVATPILTGVCGTDLEIIGGKIMPGYVTYPATIGHEWVGRIKLVGADIDPSLIGKRIVVEGIVPCLVSNVVLEALTDASPIAKSDSRAPEPEQSKSCFLLLNSISSTMK